MEVDRVGTRDENVGSGSGPAKRRGKRLLAMLGITTALALAAGGVATATADATGHPATTTAAAAAAAATGSTTAKHPQASHPGLRHLLKRTVHAQFVLRTRSGGLATFDYDRGVLRSVTSTSIAISPADAPTTTVSATITSKTHFRGLTQGQLQPGDRVVLVRQGGDAVLLGAHAPKSTSSTSS